MPHHLEAFLTLFLCPILHLNQDNAATGGNKKGCQKGTSGSAKGGKNVKKEMETNNHKKKGGKNAAAKGGKNNGNNNKTEAAEAKQKKGGGHKKKGKK